MINLESVQRESRDAILHQIKARIIDFLDYYSIQKMIGEELDSYLLADETYKAVWAK